MKYTWLKLPDDFFRQIQIKKLRKLAGGDTYVLIYQKLLLATLGTNGLLPVEIEEIEDLALWIDEEPDHVRVVIKFLEGTELVVNTSEGWLLNQVPELAGKNADTAADRMARMRARNKENKQKNNKESYDCVTKNVTDRNSVTEMLLVDKIREDKIREDNNKKELLRNSKNTSAEASDNVTEILEYYSEKTNTLICKDKSVIKNVKAILKSYSVEDFKTVIDYILNDIWYKQNCQTGISVISRPTKFYEKLERAKMDANDFDSWFDPDKPPPENSPLYFRWESEMLLRSGAFCFSEDNEARRAYYAEREKKVPSSCN